MEFGAHLPLISFASEQRTLADLTAYAETAERLGFTHLCANDHLIFSRPWLDGPTALAAVLTSTSHMRLMTTVALPVVRGLAATAKTFAAIDRLAEGRLTVGIGPGSSARDHHLVGLDFDERWKRLDDMVPALRAAWTGEQYVGPYYDTGGERLEPLPVQQPPPIWVGSWGSAAGLKRVARLADGWLASGYNTTPEAFGRAWHDLRDTLDHQGRSADSVPNGIATMWTYVTDDQTEADRVLADILAPMLSRPVDPLRAQLMVGTPEHCANIVNAYAAHGAQRIFLWPIRDEAQQLEIVRERVWPLVETATS